MTSWSAQQQKYLKNQPSRVLIKKTNFNFCKQITEQKSLTLAKTQKHWFEQVILPEIFLKLGKQNKQFVNFFLLTMKEGQKLGANVIWESTTSEIKLSIQLSTTLECIW